MGNFSSCWEKFRGVREVAAGESFAVRERRSRFFDSKLCGTFVEKRSRGDFKP